MRIAASVLFAFLSIPVILPAQDLSRKARDLEWAGDAWGARNLLQKAAQDSPANGSVLEAYAEFLDRHRDPAARAAYEQALRSAGQGPSAQRTAKRLISLDLLAGDQAALARHTELYRSLGGNPLTVSREVSAAGSVATINIPGPLRSFARMAAVSPDVTAEDLLPALARNVVTNGYQAGSGNEGLEQTEYLKLVVRYLSQARELEKLAAGTGKILKIETCESPQTADVLRIIGYRMRGGCGSELVLETVNATRAFLTIDSGFPLADLEQALRTNRPFQYDYQPTVVPIAYTADYWVAPQAKQQGGEFIDQFINDPQLCRLYLGMSKLDRDTANELRQAVSAPKLKAFAHVVDFYGANFQLRGGKALTPGGARFAKTWTDVVGVSPDQGPQFFEKLIAKDDGWLASYYDAVARTHGPLRDYLLEPVHMKRYYNAIRGKITTPGPARPVFRANTDMMLLVTRLRLDSDGKPHIPGGIEVWRNLFVTHPHGKYDGKLTKLATTWKEPDDLIEALFALCRKAVDNEPLKIFMSVSEMNRRRAKPLETATVDRLIKEYRVLGQQYPLFSEASAVSDATILKFVDAALGISQTRDNLLRADAAGTMQALVGLWQIFCRQGSIPANQADAALAGVIEPFGKAKSQRDLFDSGVAGVRLLLKATQSPAEQSVQDRMIDLLAGASTYTDEDSHRTVIADMIRLFEAQRLVSLKTLMDLSDNLDSLAKGEKLNTQLVNRLTARIAEIQLPRAALTTNEKNSMAFGYWTDKHIESQRKLNLKAAIEKAANDPEKLKDVRGQLAPFLRDTLVGLNYVHYAPPGAQVLQTNALFVRGHDFIGVQGNLHTWKTTEVFGTGWPSSAGGRLVGSLVNLPYALAEAEQNFLIPTREQALIWGDLVPQMILSAKVPRFWSVTPRQMHWVNLNMQTGEAALAEAAWDETARQQLLESFARLAPPARVYRLDEMLRAGRVRDATEHVMPAELFLVGTQYALNHKDDPSGLLTEVRQLAADYPNEVSAGAISRAFGTPKPTLSFSYYPELLQIPTFPTLMGYSSRIMAESWESNLLYYAALADEMHMAPSMLNVVVPEWTQQTVEKIFATHLEDWPALMRSLRLVGEEVRAKNRKAWAAQPRAYAQP